MPRQASSLSLGAFAKERGREGEREGGFKVQLHVQNDHMTRHGYCLTSLSCFGVRG